MANLTWVPGIPYGALKLPRMIAECRASSKPLSIVGYDTKTEYSNSHQPKPPFLKQINVTGSLGRLITKFALMGMGSVCSVNRTMVVVVGWGTDGYLGFSPPGQILHFPCSRADHLPDYSLQSPAASDHPAFLMTTLAAFCLTPASFCLNLKHFFSHTLFPAIYPPNHPSQQEEQIQCSGHFLLLSGGNYSVLPQTTEGTITIFSTALGALFWEPP